MVFGSITYLRHKITSPIRGRGMFDLQTDEVVLSISFVLSLSIAFFVFPDLHVFQLSPLLTFARFRFVSDFHTE